MAATVEVYKDKGGEFRWRLRHQNGRVIAESGQGYSNKAGALAGLQSVKENLASADMKDTTAS